MNYPNDFPAELVGLLMKEPVFHESMQASKSDVFYDMGKLRGKLDNPTIGSDSYRNMVVDMIKGVVGVADCTMVEWSYARYVIRFNSGTSVQKAKTILREGYNAVNSRVIIAHKEGRSAQIDSWLSKSSDLLNVVAVSAIGDPDDHDS